MSLHNDEKELINVKTGRFDRDGFEVNYDVLSDRKNNSNLLLVGTAGSGKSVNFLEKVEEVIGTHNARVVIAEIGNSMSLLLSYLSSEDRNFKEYKVADAELLFSEQLEFSCEDDVVHMNFSELFRKQNYEKLSNVLLNVMKIMRTVFSDDRPTLLVVDESHCFLGDNEIDESFCNEFIDEIELMNDVNTWFWASIQDTRDIAPKLTDFFNKFEWFEVAGDCSDIIKGIEEVRLISEKEKQQLMSLTNERHKYVEGILLNRNGEMNRVFRYIPKSISLSLAMSEPMERKHRLDIMRDEDLSENDAIKFIANRLDVKRGF